MHAHSHIHVHAHTRAHAHTYARMHMHTNNIRKFEVRTTKESTKTLPKDFWCLTVLLSTNGMALSISLVLCDNLSNWLGLYVSTYNLVSSAS